MANVIRFPTSGRSKRRPTFNPAARPIVPFGRPDKAVRTGKPCRDPKPSRTGHPEAGEGRGDDQDEQSTPAFPHHWDMVIMREIRELPDIPGQYASKADRKVSESKAMAAQRRVIDTFASKYLELKKRCQQLEAENRRLQNPSPSVSRKS